MKKRVELSKEEAVLLYRLGAAVYLNYPSWEDNGSGAEKMDSVWHSWVVEGILDDCTFFLEESQAADDE